MATFAQNRRQEEEPPDDSYKHDALLQLKKSFPLLSVVAIRHTFHHHNELFLPSYNALHALHVVEKDRDIKGIKAKTQIIIGIAPFLDGTTPIILKSKRKTNRSFNHRSARLLRELEGIPEFERKPNGTNNRAMEVVVHSNDKENIPSRHNKKSLTVPSAATLPKGNDGGGHNKLLEHKVTCECCYDDECNFVDMVSCSEGSHLFCGWCFNEYVKEQLFGNNRTSFRCMGSASCEGRFTEAMMTKVLPKKLIENVQKHAYREELLGSGMDSLWTCPNCDYVAFSDDGSLSIECPGCKHKSCRLCKEAPHPNQSCEESKLEKEKSTAHATLAETMTQAVIRNCPGCQTKIVKSDGCNKMVCPNSSCKTKFCYLCRQKIAGYDHFCRTPHCKHETCGKCILFSKAEADNLLRREAGLKQKAALGKAGEELALVSPQQKKSRTNPSQLLLARPDPIARRDPIDGMAQRPAFLGRVQPAPVHPPQAAQAAAPQPDPNVLPGVLPVPLRQDPVAAFRAETERHHAGQRTENGDATNGCLIQ